MSILSIKADVLLPERELVINKKLTIRQKPALIASITEQTGMIKLWIFQQMPESPFTNVNEEDLAECVTRRDEIWKRALFTRAGCGHISEITIQGIKLLTSSSSCGVIGHNPPSYMKLQHFIEKGVDFSSVENVSLNELVLAEYQFVEGTKFPEIDTKKEMPVSLIVSEESCEVLIEPSHYFKLGIGEHDVTRSFIDPSDGREIFYHINELICYDFWAETMKQFQDEETIKKLREHGHDDASIEKMKSDLPKALEDVCPKGHALLILTYECDDDFQLNFYTTEILLKKINPTGNSSSVGVIGITGSSDKRSQFGSRVCSCVLNPVPVGFHHAMEVELMTWYRRIPAETVMS